MNKRESKAQYVVCLKNEGYPASLEPRKIYQAMVDSDAQAHGLIRVVDESGEDYLYPETYFAAIELPQVVEEVFALTH
jgi:hypothetical protein